MKGWDRGYHNSGRITEAKYNKIAPGEYIFFIEAIDASTNQIIGKRSINISITSPFWKTPWFTALQLGLGLFVVAYLTRYISNIQHRRERRAFEEQQRLNDERSRISREMHDEIGSGLTQIALMNEKARSKGSDVNSQELDRIAEVSKRLMSNMNEIIWSMSPHNKDSGQLVKLSTRTSI
jgi:signal transduction histidine kinase